MSLPELSLPEQTSVGSCRIYVSEFDMHKFKSNSLAYFRWMAVPGDARRRLPMSSDIAPVLMDLSKYKGQRLQSFAELIPEIAVESCDREW